MTMTRETPTHESRRRRRAARRTASAVFAAVLLSLGLTSVTVVGASAAEACVAAWSSSAVYVGGDRASYQGHNYRAKWWTQNENPAQRSGQWDVWEDQGACGGGGGGTPTPTPTPTTTPPPGGSGGQAAAPYVYPGWGNPPAPSTVMNATGIKTFTMAFVLASNGCNPAWDGESGLTGGVHAQYIQQVKAAGGTIIPSIGGWSGNKLGPNCSTPEALAGAYQKVIDAFGLTAIDIDIENSDEFENEAVQDRILGALKIVEQRNPGITTIITFGTSTTGPTYYGKRLIQRSKDLGVPIDIYTQMPFDFGGGDMYQATVGATQGLNAELRRVFGWSEADAYKHMGISGMNGLSDQRELTTPETWTKIRDWAKARSLARFTFWSVNRDRGCPNGGVVSNCSGIEQAEWQFTRITAGY
ncbi:chitinase [Phycicoccus sp. CSK15P-2]|uniref:carbohydrate-binding protein n=1 Tax=Phycicoccus sp. CSK15P-2 TaxID=2807627 RepID=UPI00194FD1C5|nr:carbohydrate-binding protein [Phycicoccus sp. CSK15P-2]MBM6402630.1 chitinase [Phycicoccus sp. CSK15P-2]